MTRVASVRLQYDPKNLWFDPGDLEIAKGDHVIVSTARGLEFGTLVDDIQEMPYESVQALKSPLKPVLRTATDEDHEQKEEMIRLSDEALPRFKELARTYAPDMKPVMVEYLFEGNKAVFLFASEERIDFRELVRKLTSEFKVKVDMRQIGVRDEARIIGGLGHCGQELCCCRLGGEFCPVSIRMAKAQDLSLNPQQISGVCGRLMCCLRYEFETYKEFKSRAPKQNATIHTPDGDFRVCDLDTPHEVVVLRTDEGKRVRIPLSAFDEPEEGMNRPKSIGENYYTYSEENKMQSSLASFSATDFTVEDKVAEAGAIHRNPASKKSGSDSGENSSRRRRRRRSSGQGSVGERKSAERHSASDGESENTSNGSSRGGNADSSSQRKPRRKRGSRGSGKGKQSAGGDQRRQDSAPSSSQNSRTQSSSEAPAGSSHRKTRKRSHRSGGAAKPSSPDASTGGKEQ